MMLDLSYLRGMYELNDRWGIVLLINTGGTYVIDLFKVAINVYLQIVLQVTFPY